VGFGFGVGACWLGSTSISRLRRRSICGFGLGVGRFGGTSIGGFRFGVCGFNVSLRWLGVSFGGFGMSTGRFSSISRLGCRRGCASRRRG
jgi:hypothetical protein